MSAAQCQNKSSRTCLQISCMSKHSSTRGQTTALAMPHFGF